MRLLRSGRKTYFLMRVNDSVSSSSLSLILLFQIYSLNDNEMFMEFGKNFLLLFTRKCTVQFPGNVALLHSALHLCSERQICRLSVSTKMGFFRKFSFQSSSPLNLNSMQILCISDFVTHWKYSAYGFTFIDQWCHNHISNINKK